MPKLPPNAPPPQAPGAQLDLPLTRPRAARDADGVTRAVKLNGRVLPYRLRRSRRRTIALHVDSEGLFVAAPRWVSIDEIERFMREKERWIVARLVEGMVQPPRFQWQDGAELVLFGARLVLALDAATEAPHHIEGRLHLPARLAGSPLLREVALGWIREHALTTLTGITHEHAPLIGVAPPPVLLSNARTRWGSCSISPTGVARIRLNWRLALVPPHLARYVAVHELAHLREMNHSPRFWNWVACGYPEHRAAELELRKLGPALPLL
jgi:hypothetical protein